MGLIGRLSPKLRAVVGSAIASVSTAIAVGHLAPLLDELAIFAKNVETFSAAAASRIRRFLGQVKSAYAQVITLWIMSPLLAQIPLINVGFNAYRITDLYLLLGDTFDLLASGMTGRIGNFDLTSRFTVTASRTRVIADLTSYSFKPADEVRKANALLVALKSMNPVEEANAPFIFFSIMNSLNRYGVMTYSITPPWRKQ